ncbi:MAG: tail fiber domain-containing protein, partial [Candidatus Harrisonbacteria bacterium]|nr:tail fiber domain-containing protein [Candidatus Harrisonbacteria bacterium]
SNPSTTLDIIGTLRVTASTTFSGIEYLWPSADGSSGQVLSSNGAGGLSWATDATGGGGSDTDWTISGTTLYSSTTATNVGISTTTPRLGLDVWSDFRAGTSTQSTLFVDASADNVVIASSSAATGAKLTVGGAITSYGAVTADSFTTQDGSFSTNENGITTISASIDVPLTVNRDTGGQVALFSQNTAGAGGAVVGIQAIHPDTTGDLTLLDIKGQSSAKVQARLAQEKATGGDAVFYIETLDFGDPVLAFQTSGGNWVLGMDNEDSEKFKIGTGAELASSTFLTINTSGDLGIGTAYPSSTLHLLNTTEQLRVAYDGSNYNKLTVASDGGSTYALLGTDADFNFDFSGATDGDFSINSDDLFVDTSSGNVGIATTNPSTTLDIIGTLRVTASTTFSGIEYLWPSADGSSGQVLSSNGAGGLSWATDSIGDGFNWLVSGGNLTPTTTIAVELSGELYAVGGLAVATTTIITDSKLTVEGDIYPSLSLSYDLGSSSNRFRDTWTENLYVGTSTWKLSQNAGSGQLDFNNYATTSVVLSLSTTTVKINEPTGALNPHDNTNQVLQIEQDQAISLSDSVAYIANTYSGANTRVMTLQVNQSTPAPSNYFLDFWGSSGSVGSIIGNGSGGIGISGMSDQRLKENIVDSSYGLDELRQIAVKEYNRIGYEGRAIGVLAQEVAAVYPYAVVDNEERNQELGLQPGDKDYQYMQVVYGEFIPLLLSSINELADIVDERTQLEEKAFAGGDYVFDLYYDKKLSGSAAQLHPDYDLLDLEQLGGYLKENRHLPALASRTELASSSVSQLVSALWQSAEEQALYIGELHSRLSELESPASLSQTQASELNTDNLSVKTLEVKEGLDVRGPVTFNKDTVGQAEILAGDTQVYVEFDQEYKTQPIITLTAQGESGLKRFSYVVDEVTSKGFFIKVSETFTSGKLLFNWHAFASAEDSVIFVSDGSQRPVNISLEESEPHETPTLTVTDNQGAEIVVVLEETTQGEVAGTSSSTEEMTASSTPELAEDSTASSSEERASEPVAEESTNEEIDEEITLEEEETSEEAEVVEEEVQPEPVADEEIQPEPVLEEEPQPEVVEESPEAEGEPVAQGNE